MAQERANADFEAEMRTCYAQALRFATHLAGNAADGEDILQEAVIACSRHYDALRGPLHPYLMRAVYHEAAEWRRRRAMQKAFPASYSLEGLLETGDIADTRHPDLLSLLIERQEKARLRRLLATRLPDKLRRVIIAHYFLGWSYREIAQAFGEPISTIRARLHTARAALCKLLQESAEEERES